MAQDKVRVAKLKGIRLLSRETLEALTNFERPWAEPTAVLIEYVVNHYDEEAQKAIDDAWSKIREYATIDLDEKKKKR